MNLTLLNWAISPGFTSAREPVSLGPSGVASTNAALQSASFQSASRLVVRTTTRSMPGVGAAEEGLGGERLQGAKWLVPGSWNAVRIKSTTLRATPGQDECQLIGRIESSSWLFFST